MLRTFLRPFLYAAQRVHMNRCTELVVELHKTDLYSLQMIADKVGVSRQAIKKYLNKRGYDTSKANATKEVECTYCQKVFKRLRCLRRQTVNPYCSTECCGKGVANPEYIQNRQGQRIARREVAYYFRLQQKHVVHHKDGNNRNNDIDNLMVFKDQADHVRWHRLGETASLVVPLWPCPTP